MTISGKYELQRPVSAAGFRSFHARHVLTGQEVMVHFLQSGQRYEPRPVAGGSAGGALESGAQILDAGTYEGTSYLVTYPVQDFTTLSAWLESVAPTRRSGVSPAAAAAAPPRPTAPPLPPPLPPVADRTADRKAEIAAAFQDVSPRTSLHQASIGAKPDTDGFTARFHAPAAPAQARPQTQPGPGDFTQMFGGDEGASPAAPVPQPARALSPTPASGPLNPGESFTQVFAAPPAAPLSTARPAQPAQQLSTSAGDFSQMFLPPDRGPLPAAPAELGRPAAPPPSSSSAPSAPGEFTMLFSGLAEAVPANRPAAPPPASTQTPPSWPAQRSAEPWQQQVPPPPRPVPQPAPQSSSAFEGATQVFRGPGQTPQSTPAPLPMSPAGPGEFTMIMRGGEGSGSPSFGHPAAPSAPPPAPAAAPGGGAGLPGISAQAPVVSAPRLSMPSMTGPSVSASGVTPPSVHAPQVQAPHMSAPRLDMHMPSTTPAAAASPAPSGGLALSPLLAALLSCLATAALLAIVYVLIKR